jgi:uncharacterized glyoxalase superfamily protein PhnB
MEFYHSVFGGTLVINTFGEFGAPDPSLADKVMHGMLETDAGLALMGADSPPGLEHTPGNNIAISLSGDDADTLRDWWARLSDGGDIELEPGFARLATAQVEASGLGGIDVTATLGPKTQHHGQPAVPDIPRPAHRADEGAATLDDVGLEVEPGLSVHRGAPGSRSPSFRSSGLGALSRASIAGRTVTGNFPVSSGTPGT